ncbi:transposase [Nocardia sp. NPDC004168]|uniref:transposase n=1 Tax=Nocardia sp. NPDC004168 TaxID=3154452 RepID=UPI0033B6DBB7
MLRTVDLGIDARRAVSDAQIAAIKYWRTTGNDPDVEIARTEARRLVRAIADHDQQLRENHYTLSKIVERIAPGLQDTPGIGPVTGAVIVCAYSHPGRIRFEAAFAALAGVAPKPASSGPQLNRGGIRQLNRAFETIVRVRLSYDPDTRAYAARTRVDGKSAREIRRKLKRYVCRVVFRQLETIMDGA